ncbi:MAG: flagellar basal-body rod protein FlgG [Alphaproteobacteria bacterium]|jgi:flagellar basal-body rod protein FlgG|nr:flagellar basal-body rod protein FlgG [Beijerinckiaceae bacterium]NBQ38269.1 flagellar basal-body rod protein FlgG [Alphaproteobacteria bacterium]
MPDALNVAKTGLNAQQERMSVISNNLANVNTVGFKRDRANFETLLYQDLRQSGAQTSQNTQLPTGLSIGTGVRIVSSEKLYSQGNIINTDNSLDMTIQGDGFFQVLMPDGQMGYTRAGNFSKNSTGLLVSSNGYPVEPAITIPPNASSVSISTDGIVSVGVPGQAAPTVVGTIQIASFPNNGGLKPVGENLAMATGASGAAVIGNPGSAGLGKLQQGSLESSNVNVVEELVNMIETQRAYEVNSKAINAVDGMQKFLTQNI